MLPKSHSGETLLFFTAKPRVSRLLPDWVRRSTGRSTGRSVARRIPGFTLIEVLVVLVILALLAGIVTTQLLAPAETAKADATKVQIKALMAALDLYRLQNSTYPTTDQGLAALLRKPEVGVIPDTWRGPYINSNNLPVDGWKRQFLYTSDGQTFVISSLGADGVEGGTGLNADLRSTDL